MTARDEFNRMLNACHDPSRVYNALSAFASSIQKAEDPVVKRDAPDQEVENA